MDVILSRSARIIGLLIIGFLLRQGQIIRPEDGHVILCLIITITLPAVIFVSLARADVELGRLMILALCGAAIPLILHRLAMWLARTVRLKRGVAGAMVVSTIAGHQYWLLSIPVLSFIPWERRGWPTGSS